MQRLLLVMAAVAIVSCAGPSKYMTPATTAKIGPPPPDKARIVFIRPSGYAAGYMPTILDGNARFVGDAQAKAKFSVDVAPGDHVFVLWSESTRVLKASVAAGKTYYVHVAAGMGMWTASFTLRAIKPGTDSWSELEEWLAKTKTFTVNMAAGQAHVDTRKADAEVVVRKGLENWAEYDAEAVEKRTIRAGDGR